MYDMVLGLQHLLRAARERDAPKVASLEGEIEALHKTTLAKFETQVGQSACTPHG